MKIFDYDSAIFEMGILKETKTLTDELNFTETDVSKIDNGIFSAHEAYRKAQIIQASYTVSRDAGLLLDKLVREKRSLKVQADLRRNEIHNRLELLNSPLAEYLCSCADEGINRLRASIIFRRKGINKNMFTDEKTSAVESNSGVISVVREKLLGFKAEIRSLIHSPASEIQAAVQSFSEEINLVDLRQTETVEMSPSSAKDFEGSLTGTSSGPPPPQFSNTHIAPVSDPISNFLEGRWTKLKEAVGFQPGKHLDDGLYREPVTTAYLKKISKK